MTQDVYTVSCSWRTPYDLDIKPRILQIYPAYGQLKSISTEDGYRCPFEESKDISRTRLEICGVRDPGGFLLALTLLPLSSECWLTSFLAQISPSKSSTVTSTSTTQTSQDAQDPKQKPLFTQRSTVQEQQRLQKALVSLYEKRLK